MASLRKESDRGRTGWRLQFRSDGKRRSLWLGPMSKRAAEAVARHVEELVRAAAANVAPSAEAAAWASGVDDRVHRLLVRWALIESRIAVRPEDRLCGAFFENLITDRWDGRTARNYRQGAGSFVEHFGADRALASITPAEFESWHRWMRRNGLAEATANKRAKMVRTMLNDAVKAKIIAENPGAGTKIGGEVNRNRDHYVSAAAAARILGKCDVDWSIIFGLCRYAGLRCPSEVLGLAWSDVHWDDQRLRIDSTKTGLRFCPIFPSLRPLLDDAWDAAPEGAVHVVDRYRDTRESNLRTQLHRIIEAAGLLPWPKAFVNLRASCRTDLEDCFPSHVVDTWLGHSSRVARMHYLQTTDAHWERATNDDPFNAGGVTGGVISAAHSQSGAVEESNEPEKAPILTQLDASGSVSLYAQEDSNLRPAD